MRKQADKLARIMAIKDDTKRMAAFTKYQAALEGTDYKLDAATKEAFVKNPKGAPLELDGVYEVAFDVGHKMWSSAKPPTEGYKTTKGGVFFKMSTGQVDFDDEYIPYGNFKLTMIKVDGIWKRIKYGSELDAIFGDNLSIGALVIRMTGDFEAPVNFAKEVLAERQQYDEDVAIQIKVKITLPPKHSAIIRSEYLGKASYAYRVIMIPGSITSQKLYTDNMQLDYANGVINCDDSAVVLDSRAAFSSLVYCEGDPIAMTPGTHKMFAAAARGGVVAPDLEADLAKRKEAAAVAMRAIAEEVSMHVEPSGQVVVTGPSSIDTSNVTIEEPGMQLLDDND